MTIRENDLATRERGGIHMLNVRARIQRGPVEQEDWANKNPSGIQQGEAQSFGAERKQLHASGQTGKQLKRAQKDLGGWWTLD